MITSEAKSAASRDPYDLGFLDNEGSYTVEARSSRGNLRLQRGEVSGPRTGIEDYGNLVQSSVVVSKL